MLVQIHLCEDNKMSQSLCQINNKSGNEKLYCIYLYAKDILIIPGEKFKELSFTCVGMNRYNSRTKNLDLKKCIFIFS